MLATVFFCYLPKMEKKNLIVLGENTFFNQKEAKLAK